MTRSRALSSRQRGALAVELALLSIPLILMSLAVLEFGRVLYTYNQLVKLTREGARYLSAFDPSNSDTYGPAITRAKNRMVYGTNTTGSQPVVAGLTPAMIIVCDRINAAGCPGGVGNYGGVTTGSGTIDLVEVRITGYQFNPLFPGTGQLTSMTFEPISTTMRQGR